MRRRGCRRGTGGWEGRFSGGAFFLSLLYLDMTWSAVETGVVREVDGRTLRWKN